MNYNYNENQTKVKNGMSYLQKYSGGLRRTIDYSEYTGWTPESQAIIKLELTPQVEAIEKTISKIVQEEELAEIYTQLAEEPVVNVKVEPDKEEFVLKDSSTGTQISKGNVEIIKGLLEVMHKMQKDNGLLLKEQYKELPVKEDNNEESF